MEDDGDEGNAYGIIEGYQKALAHYNNEAVPMVINGQNDQVRNALVSFCRENGLQYGFTNWSVPSSAVVSTGGGSNYPSMNITDNSGGNKVNIVFPRDRHSLFFIFSGDGRTSVKEFEHEVNGRVITSKLIEECKSAIPRVFKLGEVRALWEYASGMSQTDDGDPEILSSSP